MKKAILTFVIAFAGIITANAQVWLGGSLGFNTNKAEGQRGTYLFLGPEVGYSFGDWSHISTPSLAVHTLQCVQHREILFLP